MADQQTSWETLYNGLRRDSHEQDVASALAKFHQAAQPGTKDVDFQQQVRQLFDTYGQRYGITQSTADINKVLKQSQRWRDENFLSPEKQQETPPPRGPEAPKLSDFFGQKKDYQASADYLPYTANQQLHDKQKEATVAAFELLLRETPADQLPQAIERFYHEHLSAAGILGDQYQVLMRQSERLYRTPRNSGEFDKATDTLREQAEKQERQLRSPHTTYGPLREGDQRQRDEENDAREQLLALASGDVNDRDELVRRASGLVEGAFETGWGRTGSDALEHVVGRLRERGIGATRYNLIEGVDEALETTYVTTTTVRPEQPPEALPPQQPSAPGGSTNSSLAGRLLPRMPGLPGAKGAAKSIEKEVAEQAVAIAGRAALTPVLSAILPVLGIIALIIGVVIIIVIIISKFTSSSTPSIQAGIPPSCGTSSSCLQQLQAIGFTLTGDLSLNGDPLGKTQLVYSTLATVMQQPSKFGTLLGLPNNKITLSFAGGGCAGHSSPSGVVIEYGFGSCGTGVARFMLLHELGHQIAFRNPSLFQKFTNQFPLSVLTSYKLPTFNCEFDYGPGGPYPGECFADTVAEYVVYKTYRNTLAGPLGIRIPVYFEATFSSFKTLFAPFYNFAKDNVYNGLEF